MSGVGDSSASASKSVEIPITVRWCGKEYNVKLCGKDTIGDLKRQIWKLTKVLPSRQTLLYKKMLPLELKDDSTLVSQIYLKASVKIIMIGTVENDVDQVDYAALNDRTLVRCMDQYKIVLRNPCRVGKKLLVIDIDRTLCDVGSATESSLSLIQPRPYLHQFLARIYENYDIMIWSTTSMQWAELKMIQLRVTESLRARHFKFTALIDHLAMITIQLDPKSLVDCKPLELIWGQFPQFYSSKNTIAVDDSATTFSMNPLNGLTVTQFKEDKDGDQELRHLSDYLCSIADLEDFSKLDHHAWNTSRRAMD